MAMFHIDAKDESA